VGAIALAALALAASALQVSREGSGRLVPTPAVTRHDPFAAELERCNAITPTSGRDDACERAWTENRWRFLGASRQTSPDPVVERREPVTTGDRP